MARLYRTSNGRQAQGERIPLSHFNADIVVIRTDSTPDPSDESWTRKAVKLAEFQAAVEEGQTVLIKGDKQSDKEFWLFAIPREPDDAYQFATSDYVVWGDEAYAVKGFLYFSRGGRDYVQINTLPWGKIQPGDFIRDDTAPVDPAEAPPVRDNPFWDN